MGSGTARRSRRRRRDSARASSPEAPLLLRGLDVLRARLEEGEVLRVLVLEDLVAGAHVGAHQLVGGAIAIAGLELALAQTQVEEGIADRARAAHRVREIVAARRVVAAEKVGVADGGEDPGRRLPLDLRLGEQIPRGPVAREGIGVASRPGVLVSRLRQPLDLGVHLLGKFGHTSTVTPGEFYPDWWHNGPRTSTIGQGERM